jgi:predicted AlkP superfamily phosphohydrolase/phosphomutase
VALDAFDADLVLRWAREGRLPAIASILARGAWATTAGPDHLCEHGTWLSLLSGRPRGDHGHYYFRELVPGTYSLAPATYQGRGVLPFWAGLAGTGRTALVVDPPDAGVVPGLDGVQVANWLGHEAACAPIVPRSLPPETLESLRREFGPRSRIDEFAGDAALEQDAADLAAVLERARRKGAIARSLAARHPADLVVAGFFEAHAAGHRFWRRGVRPGDGEPIGRAVRDVYAAIDAELGRLLAELPRDADVFLVSAYGMEDQRPTTGLSDAFCRALGYHAAPAAGRPGARPPLSRLLPQGLRACIARKLPASFHERRLARAFESGAAWERTTAFAVPSLYTSFLRVNLRGREPQGAVEPGAEYDALLDRVEEDLSRLVDPATGESPLLLVTRAASPSRALPDVFVEWRPSREFVERLDHPRAALVQERPRYDRDSYHSHRGFVAAAGPRVAARGDAGVVSLLDLAPTFLARLGLPAPPEMPGRPIAAFAASEATA